MIALLRTLILFAAVWLCAGVGLAQPFIQLDPNSTLVCPVLDAAEAPPDPSTRTCERQDLAKLNVGNEAVWVFGTISPTTEMLGSTEPLGLHVAAKAAMRIYFNGDLLASNGVPGLDRGSEQAGKIDAVYFIPRDKLLRGANRVELMMSGHRNLLAGTQSVLMLGLFGFDRVPYHERDTTLLSFLMLGIFLLTALYAVVLASYAIAREATLTLLGLSLFAAGQVIAEALRSLWSYPYYVHDLRLIAIIACGLGVGLTLLSHTLQRFEFSHARIVLAATLIAALLGIGIVSGFDGKASMAILVPCVVTSLVAFFPTGQAARLRKVYGGVFAVFAMANVVSPGEFLDLTYFAMLTILILLLSVFQAMAFVDAVEENEKGAQVQRQLDDLIRLRSTEDQRPLIVQHSGKTERIECDDIESLEAAGDYVIISLIGGRRIMLTAALSALEAKLPAKFLRVHRSRVVNSDQVASLQRLPSGTGELILKTGAVIPVSRRTMPKVRQSVREA